ncbi:hypothetical protein JGS22_009965 [Streptomyces sp. P38-E01]|uniref:Uncharacterized protein n=1 Tax=Streptomyces tardus TaxID=2780544 RepID=A0A949N4H8_9ACTN|nr:hypothetical protein [Streptomyces tardus]MBU7597934.1 hypothetical protein [Streptomyces tardus]
MLSSPAYVGAALGGVLGGGAVVAQGAGWLPSAAITPVAAGLAVTLLTLRRTARSRARAEGTASAPVSGEGRPG